jgi:adenosylhomocysteinase
MNMPQRSTQSRQNFPIMDLLAEHLCQEGILAGRKIGWHCHLTSITLTAAEAAVKAGARLYLSQCNAATTMDSAVQGLMKLGVEVYTGEDCTARVLAHHPEILSDTGFVLCHDYIKMIASQALEDSVLAATEITSSGITRLRNLNRSNPIPFSVVNINGGELKSSIENFHGVGEGLLEALQMASGQSDFSDKLAVVAGYGQVGSGCAHYLHKSGARVKVLEADPVRALKAHYDGFPLTTMDKALEQGHILVTATGQLGLWQAKHFSQARDGLIVVNVGHDKDEVSPQLWQESATRAVVANSALTRYIFGDKSLYLVAGGNPANVALLTGSVEPTLIHLATEILTWEYLIGRAKALPTGENCLPRSVEEVAGRLALEALGYDNASFF